MLTPILLNNRYRVIETLGSGGFGETFLAEDTQMPSNRCCVVKQLRPIQNNQQIYQLVQERFQREAAILEELGGVSEQIPNLYAYFQTDGQFYLVQEWIEGHTLSTIVEKQGLFSENYVHEILVSLLEVLDYVHSKKIIHRDIKPDNIILRQRDRKPVLIDFGAVRETMGTVVNSQGNTTSSIVIGTPGYMPNEQAAGRAIYSSDLYSLGITAIYLLTGKQPQELEIDVRTGEIIWQQHALNISQTMQEVLQKAVASHPINRFTTASEMLQALRSHLVTSQSQTTIPQPKPTLVTPVLLPQQTVSISPKNSEQPSNQINQTNGQNSLIISSLIVGSLVGVSVIIGFAFNKQPQQVTQEPQVQKTASSNEKQLVRQKPLTQEITSTPQAAQQALRNYYSAINNKQYQTAWNHLSIQHQNNPEAHPNGINSFKEWWQQVGYVDIKQLTNQKFSNEMATIDSQLRYSLKSGRTIFQSIRFFLVWDAESQQWLIDSIQKLE